MMPSPAMPRGFWKLGACWVLGCAAAWTSAAPPTAPTRYRLAEGMRFRDTWSGVMRVDEGPRGGPPQIFSMEWVEDLEVLSVEPDGHATLKSTIVRERTTITHGLNPVPYFQFDSTRPEEPITQFTRERLAFFGRSFRFTIDPAGHVVRIEGLDEMIDSILLFAQTKTHRAESFRRELEGRFSEAAIRGNLEGRLMHFFPPDDHGRRTHTFEAQGWVPHRARVTLGRRRPDPQSVRFDFTAELSEHPDAPPRWNARGIEAWKDVRGRRHGWFELDPATGWLTEEHMEESLTATRLRTPHGGFETPSPFSRWSQITLRSKRLDR